MARARRYRPRSCAAKTYPWFKKHAGGGRVGHSSEGALSLARAECTAAQRGWKTRWEHDEDPDLSWASKRERESIKEVLCARIVDRRGETLDSLCGIVDPDRNYARVVAAELASQALYEKRKRKR